MDKLLLGALIIVILNSCVATQNSYVSNNNQEKFWTQLNSLCGKAFKGKVVSAPANDTVFRNKDLWLHVRSCEAGRIRIPFTVGTDRSRTFILSRQKNSISFNHDHRHAVGSEDSLTMYGGVTSNSGSANVQFFPAHQHTVNILPAAAGNVWWIEIDPGTSLRYNLRRLGTDRIFTVEFDLTTEVDPPPAPWGWID